VESSYLKEKMLQASVSFVLLNIEGKIFFSIIAQRLSTYLLKNGFIDGSKSGHSQDARVLRMLRTHQCYLATNSVSKKGEEGAPCDIPEFG